MKTKISLALTLVTIVAAPAWAGGNNGQKHNFSTKPWFPTTQNRHQNSHHHSHPSNRPPIQSRPITSHDLIPNPPQGSPSVTTSNPPSRPGFVWVGNHWERARTTSRPMTGPPPVANGGGGVTVTPANSKPTIRDHRPGAAQGGVTVFPTQGFTPPPVVLRPATTVPSSGHHGAGGRPHHANRAPGGVSVSVVPGSQRPNDVTGVGGSPIDKGIESVISIFDGGSITPAGKPAGGIRDHRR